MKSKQHGWTRSRFTRQLALVFGLACGFAGIAAQAQNSQPVNPPRLDEPVTPANSVLVDFGDGAILRVPKFLIAESMIPKDPKQPVKMKQISMAFQFPDMELSEYQSALGSIVITKTGDWKWSLPKPGRFPVHINWLFHSTEGINHDWTTQPRPITIWKSKWRPVTMVEALEINIRESAKAHHVADDKLTFSDAKYEGLREIHVPVTDPEYQKHAEKMWRESGWDGKYAVDYVERVGSPYELYMECEPIGGRNSSKCEADVYIKSNQFQYHMTFPPDAVSHTDQLIRTIDKMVDGWVQK